MVSQNTARAPSDHSSGAKDRFDLHISGATTEGAAGFDHYVTEFLSYGSGLRNLFDVADSLPDCALINAHAATLHLAFEGAEGWDAAAPYLDRMRAARNGITEREALYCEHIEAWVQRDFHSALDALDRLTVRWPADLCALKWGQYHAFNLGNQEALLRFGQRATIVHENSPYVHGLIAFALEQNHHLEEAEEQGRHAVEIAIDDAWAHHAIAHVLETQGRIRDGIRWLDHCSHTWEGKGVFIRDHNWWHNALFHIEDGEHQRALEIYDEHLWGNWPEFPQEQIGAVSTLWRLEMLGVDVGDRWTPVVEQARARSGEHILPFHDLHYAFALGRCGTDQCTERFLNSLSQHCERQSGKAHQVWDATCQPLAKALIAFSRSDYETTIEEMRPALATLQSIGGSHAQRQIFLDTFAYAQAQLEGPRAQKWQFWQ